MVQGTIGLMPEGARHLRERGAEHDAEIIDVQLGLRGRQEAGVQIDDGFIHGVSNRGSQTGLYSYFTWASSFSICRSDFPEETRTSTSFTPCFHALTGTAKSSRSSCCLGFTGRGL